MIQIKTPTTRTLIDTAADVRTAKRVVQNLYPNSTVRFCLDDNGNGWAYANRQRIAKLVVDDNAE